MSWTATGEAMKTIEVVFDPARRTRDFAELRDEVLNGAVLIVRSAIDPVVSTQIVEYLRQVGKGSLPNYSPIEIGALNGHRLNRRDERSYVKGCFHQFAFYPWNQDVFDLFELLRPVYQFKNRLSGFEPDRYLGPSGEDGVVSRLAFQCYPIGSGFMNAHEDPVGDHQVVVSTMMLSAKGTDFTSGGLYLENSDGSVHCLDDHAGPGDVVFFDARSTHSVKMIDGERPTDWLAFNGRWSLLLATNKTIGVTDIGDAVEVSGFS